MQSAPRPPASVPLGGSLRASRAARLARPDGPLAAVDLADGRSLVAELRGAVWIAVAEDSSTLELPACPEPGPVLGAPAPVRRRRLAAAVAVAAAFGAAAVALATGFSGAPAPAVASPTARPVAAPIPSPPRVRTTVRGGRAVALPPPRAAPPAAAPSPEPMAVSPPAAPAPPPPPPLPELPSAPAL